MNQQASYHLIDQLPTPLRNYALLQLQKMSSKRAHSNIKYAFIVSIITLVMDITVVVVSLIQGTVSLLIFSEFLLVAMLVVGIRLKNEYSTFAYICYLILIKVIFFIGFRKFATLIGGVVALFFLYEGLLGMLKYWTEQGEEEAKTRNRRIVYGACAIVLALLTLLNSIAFVLAQQGASTL